MRFCSVLIFAATLPAFAQQADTVAGIFASSCAGCHSAKAHVGGLDLETYSGLNKVIVPGDSSKSKLYLMITGAVKPTMPMGGTLAEGEIQAIKTWIDAGAPELPKKSTSAAVPKIEPKGKLKPQIYAMAYSANGKWIALAGFKQVRILDSATMKTAATLDGAADAVRGLAFSPDGKLLAAAGGLPARKGQVQVWDVEQKKLLRTIEGHDDCIYGVAFAPDGKWLATSSYDKLIKLWDPATGHEVRTLKDHIDAVYALAFTRDGKRLISGAADRTIKIWNPATGERLYTLGEPTDGINSIVLSPDGSMVAAGGLDKTIRVWKLGEKNATLLNTLIAHEDAILKLAWSPDGKTIVSSSSDGTIKLFAAQDLTEIKTLAHQPDWIYALEFSPDGKTLTAGRFDGSISVYETQKYTDLNEVRTASR